MAQGEEEYGVNTEITLICNYPLQHNFPIMFFTRTVGSCLPRVALPIDFREEIICESSDWENETVMQ